MKLTNLYTIVTILLVLNFPLAVKSETIGQDIIKCPIATLHANKIGDYAVVYSRRISAVSLEADLLVARKALVSFWDKQLTDSKDFNIEPNNFNMKGSIARLSTLGPVTITSNAVFTEAVD